jgi:hypothetical protein
MNSLKKCFTFIIAMSCLYLYGEEDLKTIDELIAISERQLEKQKGLKKEMLLFEEQKKAFLNGEQTIAHTTSMIRTATLILSIVTENHLNYLFSSEYLEELALFTSIGSKKGPSRP